MKDSLPIKKPLKSNVYDDYVRLQRKVADLTLENKRLKRELRLTAKNAC
ncbi:hypothetical protein [Exiguobacterium sp. CinTr1]|nr:hypothetical protein [Exiguobacterium sp. CinTr1]